MSLTCLEFRQIVGAEPASRDPAVLEHRGDCRACAEFAQAQAALDRRLEAALRVAVPEDLPARVIWRQTAERRRRFAQSPGRWLALAASLLLAAGLGFVLTLQFSGRALATEVVTHIEDEPALLVPPFEMAAAAQVNAVLERGGVALARSLDDVTHAGLCPFRGRLVPHLVVQVNGEPVSILLLPEESLPAPRTIDEDGYHGVIVPRGDGSIAIVGARQDLVVPVRERIETAVNWQH